MKSDKLKIRIFSSFWIVTMLICTFCSPVLAKADSQTIKKEILFSTENASDKKDDEFPQTIKENGKTYQLVNVSYEIVDQTPLSIKQNVTKEVVSDLVSENEEFNPEETLEEDGVIYTLDHIDELSGTDGAVQTVTGYTDYSKAVSENSVPKIKNITAKNDQTGEMETVSCNLVNVERLSNTSWEDTYIDIVFESYDSNIFRWNGLTVSKDTDSPLSGYESQLLASVGVNSNNYRVLRTYWNGNSYTDSNGVLCRNARADVQRKVNYYRANYKGEIQLSEMKSYKAVYTGIKDVTSEDQFSYTMKATAIYEPVNNTLLYALSGVCILLFIVLIVLLLYLLAKRKKDNDSKKIQYVDIEKEN